MHSDLAAIDLERAGFVCGSAPAAADISPPLIINLSPRREVSQLVLRVNTTLRKQRRKPFLIGSISTVLMLKDAEVAEN